jgi:hypothetical protein
MKVEPVNAAGDRRPPRMPDRGDRRGLVDQGHKIATEEVAQNVLHVRHHQDRDLAATVRHRSTLGQRHASRE